MSGNGDSESTSELLLGFPTPGFRFCLFLLARQLPLGLDLQQ